MNSFSKALVRCRVLYLGSASVKNGTIGFESLQKPLSCRYKGGTEVHGVDSKLVVYDNGIHLEFFDAPGQVVWFPIDTLAVCAATKCVLYVDGASGEQTRKFVPLDVLEPDFGDSSPPIFGFITRAKDMHIAHVFLCKTDLSSLMLVQCLTTAYDRRDSNVITSVGKVTNLPETGAFLSNAKKFVHAYNISKPNDLARNAPFAGASLGYSSQKGVDPKVAAKIGATTLPPGMRIVYVPESIVKRGGEALKQYVDTLRRPPQYGYEFTRTSTKPAPSSTRRSHGLASVPPPPRVANTTRNVLIPVFGPAKRQSLTPMSDVILEQPPAQRGRSASAERSHKPNINRTRSQSPPPDYDLPSSKSNSQTVGNAQNANKNHTVPSTPPPDYDTNKLANGNPVSTAAPLSKLSDVVRQRADSAMDESAVIRNPPARRRQPDVVQHYAGHDTGDQRAFGQHTGDDIRGGRPMVVGHGPSSVYEVNGNERNRLFDDLQYTLGYYP